jgi:hypothetical protein
VRVLGTVAKGETAGDIVYHLAAIGFNADCDGRLLALSAAGQVYEFDERILGGPCVNNGMVVLTRDPAAGTLRYEWYSSAGTKCCDALLTRTST